MDITIWCSLIFITCSACHIYYLIKSKSAGNVSAAFVYLDFNAKEFFCKDTDNKGDYGNGNADSCHLKEA